jgi:L-ascorbate metabolism protein UlaG (beta-lactamase superfamily)
MTTELNTIQISPTFFSKQEATTLTWLGMAGALGIEQERLIKAMDYTSLELESIKILATPALHDWQEENPWQRGECCGYVIKGQDGAIWHPGDTRLIDDLLSVKDIDLLFFDVAAVESHLGPEGSARLGASCGAKMMIIAVMVLSMCRYLIL